MAKLTDKQGFADGGMICPEGIMIADFDGDFVMPLTANTPVDNKIVINTFQNKEADNG